MALEAVPAKKSAHRGQEETVDQGLVNHDLPKFDKILNDTAMGDFCHNRRSNSEHKKIE
ncbi:hypothetical protein [Pararhizobium sp. PWRC1-1]|uniref:hypothetical protein n=1 Tax=Pararhizobium sp. PWRC1-1 TaxID=2804566 RepID=UPI003CEDC654